MNEADARSAMVLFRQGKDTAEIAALFTKVSGRIVTEAHIYNWLALIRNQQRSAAA